jgi:hypothetical protein
MLSFFVPAIGQFGLLTIPLWLRLFMTRAERKAAAQA